MRVNLVLGRRRFVLVLVIALVYAVLHLFLVLLSCMVQPVCLVDEFLATFGTLYHVPVVDVAGMTYQVFLAFELLFALLTGKLFGKQIHVTR